MSQPIVRIPRRAVRISSTFPSSSSYSLPCLFCASQFHSRDARQFTTTRRRDAAPPRMQSFDSKLPKAYSSKTQMIKQKTDKATLPNDLGRMPGIIVLATRSGLPGRAPATLLKGIKIRWLRLKMAVTDWFSIFYLQYWDAPKDAITGKKNRKPLELGMRNEIARSLHKTFNTALAEGDMNTLENIACDGLLQASRTRIENRKRHGTDESWTLENYRGITYPAFLEKWPLSALLPFSSTRVVSDRLAPLPFPDSTFRQCTVRIKSVQSFQAADESKPKISSRVEYVVIQRLQMNGKDPGWRLWGTVDPSTMEEIDKLFENLNGAETLAGRFKEQMSTMTGFGGV